MTTDINAAKWARLREPFREDEIDLLPRYTGSKENKGKNKQRCAECGGYHDFPSIHLHYVGHANITERFTEVDPEWTWEPMGRDAFGLPALDANGGLWANLTILGVTKPAYGDPGTNFSGGSKKGTPDGMKEAIGDMLRNGAMRFGCGTYLWSKSDSAKAKLLRGIEGQVDPDEHTEPAFTPAPVRAEGPSAYLLTFGKHNGTTLEDLDKTDEGRSYILWLSQQDAKKPATQAARAYLEALGIN